MAKYSDEFLEQTRDVWQKYSKMPLTLEDAREIAENMTALFTYLDKLELKYDKETQKKKSKSN